MVPLQNTTLESLNFDPLFRINPCSLDWLPENLKRFSFNTVSPIRKDVELPNLESLYLRLVSPVFGFFYSVTMENLRTLNISSPLFHLAEEAHHLIQPDIFRSCPNLYELICHIETLPFFMTQEVNSIRSLILVDYVKMLGTDGAVITLSEFQTALQCVTNVNTIMLHVSRLVDAEFFDYWKHTINFVTCCRNLERLVYDRPRHVDSTVLSPVHYFEYRTDTNMYYLYDQAQAVNIPKVRRILDD